MLQQPVLAVLRKPHQEKQRVIAVDGLYVLDKPQEKLLSIIHAADLKHSNYHEEKKRRNLCEGPGSCSKRKKNNPKTNHPKQIFFGNFILDLMFIESHNHRISWV